MTRYRILERRDGGGWMAFGVAYEREGRVVLFAPPWRAERTLAVASLDEIQPGDAPSADFRWRPVTSELGTVRHPIELLRQELVRGSRAGGVQGADTGEVGAGVRRASGAGPAGSDPEQPPELSEPRYEGAADTSRRSPAPNQSWSPESEPRQERATDAPRDDLATRLARLLRLLGDASRVRILMALRQEPEVSVAALCQRLGQSQPAVSHHLTLLRLAGLVSYRREGKNNFYRLGGGAGDDLPEAVINLLAPVLEGEGAAEPAPYPSGSARRPQVSRRPTSS
jgi:ArsR family transcriptional regulator